jgi:hypothetical protein
MAQQGNDFARPGLVSNYPDNVADGLDVKGEESWKDTSLKTKRDGDPMYRGPHSSNYSGWVFPGKPGID